jgi:phage shock protein PspC (stress-responsive transcriptional regulator)
MQRVIDIDLTGAPHPFRVHEDAYDALTAYLDGAKARLTDDPDQAEVMGDLEASIGAKLADRIGAVDRVLTIEDIAAVLDAVGPVGSADDRPAPAATDRMPRRRRLYRIREDQWIAGVCTGLAAYSEIGVDWVRTIFLLLMVLTAGLFLFVYVALAFLLPVVATRDAWAVAMDEA